MRARSTKGIIGLLLAISLPGCQALSTTAPQGDTAPSRAATEEDMLAALHASGIMGRIDLSDDPQGPDVDGNGVRDDVDEFIRARTTPGSGLQLALMQVAKAQRMAMRSDISPDDSRRIYKSMESGVFTLMSMNEKSTILNASVSWVTILEIFATSTAVRLKKYYSFLEEND